MKGQGYDSSADSYDYVYYGTWSNENVKWRVLSMNGNGGTYSDGTNAVGSDGAMFLLSDELLGTGSNGSVYFQQNYHTYVNNDTWHKGSDPDSDDHSSRVNANVWQGSDCLYIFNEQCNGDYKTDYASEFQPVSLTKNVFSVTNTLTNITSSNTAISHIATGDYTTTLSVSGVYRLPESITVSADGRPLTAGTDYTYESSTGELIIPSASITGDIIITAAGIENKEMTPNVSFTATGDSGGTLSGVEAGMQYSADGGNSWTTIRAADINKDNSISVSSVTASNGIQVKRSGNGTTTVDSDIQRITVTQAAQPTGIGKADCTTYEQDDGQITGVDNTMEYRLSTVSDWTSITADMLTDGNLTGLSSGTYYVRVKAAGTMLASPYAEVTVATPSSPTMGGHTGRTDTPETGDDNNIALWIAVIIASGAALTGTVLYRRKKNA